MIKKICFIASSGGHFEQLMMLKPLMDSNRSFIVTEKTNYAINTNKKVYYLKQVNRHEFKFIPLMIFNLFKSLNIFLKEKPDLIISTGALSVIPMCIISKIFRKKIIFIESFAKVTSPTLTGKLIYKFADRFYIQWESLRKFYPNAINKGGIY
ncbi:PssD/Cps14F family polysaccharide biosynthesis glycosyltransferase [Clostridium perfringens]|uniref:PssD/Cps14F family polysaccharide biosynthesis glycosyltransferase n=1 Tax=Clostridium perfringens TaxID=1502 RepID=UPI001A20EA38|nr:PssD/Cps14F family polysaccharide biosynthesis glycosyltransferase [Clostridium perfringens]MDH5068010.1 Undecaprenyl-PP-MurNAc-pentapeptide-UDPGlcNAc GlcNAc transferase [Clostridium perfringens]HAT4119817.1 polysaccharide biosynthesis protein [Clostridium perfringens]HAT4120711.1 polysaccharide biosynthesis protein [Clostridium perfringens]